MIQQLHLVPVAAAPVTGGTETVPARRRPAAPRQSETLLVQLAAYTRKGMGWLQQKRRAQIAAKRLRVCETVSLGEKRFISLVQVDGKQFLIGGAPNSVSMLAQLDSAPTFPDVLKQQLSGGGAGE